MKSDDDLHDALRAVRAPNVDVEDALGHVHRRARRTRAARLGGPIVAVLLIAAASVTLVAQNNGGDGRLAMVRVVRSPNSRGSTTPAQAASGAAAVNAFSLDLFKQVAGDKPGNLVLSPYSVDQVLTMSLPGAQGTTHDQIAKVLHVGADEGDYHQALNALDSQLAKPREGQDAGSDPDHPGKTLPKVPPVALHVADSVWVQRGFAVEQAFLERLARSYGAGVHTVDFAKEAEASRRAVNAWVSDHTDGRITDLLAKGDVDTMTRLVLVNAVTFTGKWTTPFDDPKPGSFTTGSGAKVRASMMGGTEMVDGASGPGWRSASVPYVGGAHMLVILPDDLDAYVASLTAETFQAAAATKESNAWMSLTIPTFDTTSRTQLDEPLKALGMPDAFDRGRADFSGIAPEPLYVGTVVQQAHIKVDRYGTEAEAATAMTFQAVGAAIGPVPLVLDHPFLYAIVDDASGAILFMGRVDDPTATS
jgi:serpin B